jgi:hypothetical protein
MPCNPIHYLGTLQPVVTNADVWVLASAIDQLADLALSHCRAAYAEDLARRAADSWEAWQW